MSKHRYDRYDDILTQMFFARGFNYQKKFFLLRRIYRGKLIYWL
jgi:hypothetical protein